MRTKAVPNFDSDEWRLASFRDIHLRYNKDTSRYEVATSSKGRVGMFILGSVFYYRHVRFPNIRGAEYQVSGDTIIRMKKWGFAGDEKNWATAIWVEDGIGCGRFKLVAPWERIEFRFTHPPRRPANIKGVSVVVRAAQDRSVRFSKHLLRKPGGWHV